MAERVRGFDWAATPLGPIAQWPQSLKTAVGMVLFSPVPIVMLWGEDGIMIYNDGYSQFAGQRHPSLLGSKVREGWPEVADFNDNIMKVGLAGGTLAYRGIELSLNRTGTFAPAWLDLDYSPILDESGAPAGVMAIVIEITKRVLAEKNVRAASERFAEMFRQAPSFIAQLEGPEHVFNFANNAYQQLIGNRDIIGKTIREALPEIEGQGFFELLDQVYRSGEAFVGHTSPVDLRRIAGAPVERILLDFVYQPIKAADGTVAGIFVEGFDVTEQHVAADALRRSEERLRLATENAGIGLWDIDPQQGINLSYSHERAAFSMPQDRKTPAEEFFTHVHPDDLPQMLKAYGDARDPQKRTALDVEYRTLAMGDIPARWMAIKGRGVFDADGNCVRMSGTAIDITTRKQAEEALRRSEEQLRLATEYADVGLWDIDLVNDVVYWPARVNEMFGFAPGETVTMKDFRAAIHPDDKRRTYTLILAASDPAQRAFYDAEYRIIRKNDGAVRWLSAKGRAVFDDAGVCVRMLGVIVDITARKTAEQEILELNETLERKIIERTQARGLTWQVTPDLMGALNSEGYFETSNPAWQTLLGWSEKEVASMSIFELLHPDDLERTRVGFNLTQIGQPAIRFPNRYRCKDGSYRWISWVGVPEDGMVYCTGRDITEEKAAEAQLALAQESLRQSQKMEAIGNLTGGFAHDFNNLLQGLTGSLDLIRRRADDAERVKRWAEAGLQAAGRGAKLTAQLLAFSRSQKLELKPLNLSALLLGMRELMERTLGPSVRVSLDLDQDAANVMGDETQLELAVLNLAINARDVMPQGGELILTTRRHTSEGRAELAAGEYIELSVRDTGSGMPPDIIARAFDPFFTTKGVGKGTGLGLSQVYGMARQAGGGAQIQSAQGEGTTISIFLPITEANAALASTQAENGPEQNTASATILIVDDDPDVRSFLADSLDAFGYAVMQAEDGPSGLAALARTTPDLMILDYAMPGMTGAEVAHQVRVSHPGLPILFASGYAETSALKDVVADDSLVLRKPFRMSELQDAVIRALQR